MTTLKCPVKNCNRSFTKSSKSKCKAALAMHMGRAHTRNIVAKPKSDTRSGKAGLKWEPHETDAVHRIAKEFGNGSRVAWKTALDQRPDLFVPLKNRDIKKIHSYWNSLKKVKGTRPAKTKTEAPEIDYEALLADLNHCPRCGFNMRALLLALPVAVKHSARL